MVKLLFIVYFLAYVTSTFANVVDEGIKQISLDERICIKIFFDQAIKHYQAAHVIYFDNKPVCIMCCTLKHRDKTYYDVLALRGWLAFKKNENLFPHPNFIFNENISISGNDCKILHIYLINKKSLARCLDEHNIIFKEVLGPTFSKDSFITKLKEGVPLPSLLNNDEMLLGILLGYGIESASVFKEMRKQCTNTYAPSPTNTYCRIDLNLPKKCKISPVVFMGNPKSMEVQKLCSTYETELETIWKAYRKSKNQLTMVLENLCTPQ